MKDLSNYGFINAVDAVFQAMGCKTTHINEEALHIETKTGHTETVTMLQARAALKDQRCYQFVKDIARK